MHASFKFCAMLFGEPARSFAQTRCAFYLHQLAELDEPARTLVLSADDFARVNPNTGAAPIFRDLLDAAITLALYARHPVLVRHGAASRSMGRQPDAKVWPIKYQRMFDMTNDSHLFLTAGELQKAGFRSVVMNRWNGANNTEAVPLYVGCMIHLYDHRHAHVTVNEENLQNAALSSNLN